MKQLGVLRFVVAAGLIALTAILLEARGRTELVPSRLPLSSFPAQLGDWFHLRVLRVKIAKKELRL